MSGGIPFRSPMQIGSLFSGYGGLELGIINAIGGEVAWHCEFDQAPSKILEARFPGIPNFGDVTKVDWNKVEPIDVLCGGFPCQDVSLAGKRAGLKEGTRSGLWSYFAEAIKTLKPRMVVIENVRGLLSATANSDMEYPTEILEQAGARPILRAISAVLGDLADLGYDARWETISAASAGAPHRRERVFIIAYPSSK
jgi:DNA (cytosine-5)-methyltransferase 1